MTNPAAPTIQEGPGKGRAFFERARTVADSGNYDYAFDMWIEGLNREPQNIEEHKALFDMSLKRKVKGGKPAGGFFGVKTPLKGKSPKEQMLNAEWLLAKDPGNITHMRTLLKSAVAAEYTDVIRWFAPVLLLANKTKPRKDIFLDLADIYESIEEFNKASEALQGAIELSPTDMELIARAKDLAAKEAIQKGKYEQAGSFKESIKDKEQTKALLQEENLIKSKEHLIRQMESAKEDYEQNPTEHQVIAKYAKTLVDINEEEYEQQAVALLEKAFADTKTYRYKLAIGDIKMKQFKRNSRLLREALQDNPNDKNTQQQLHDLERERLAFELEEYKNRVANYPTDMGFQFEYGVRLYRVKHYDEAIHAFQIAQSNPRHRTDALYLLGRSFLEQSMKPEAIETFRRAIEAYGLAETGDQKSKEYHYWLARALEETANAAEALALYSKITQWDISFLDARARLEALRKTS